MTFADVPVPINPRIVRRARIVEMDGAHIFQSDCLPDYGHRRFQSIGFANVITRSKRMRSVDAHSEREFGAGPHDRAQMLEAVADAFALARSVLQQDLQFAETQSFASDLQTERANL